MLERPAVRRMVAFGFAVLGLLAVPGLAAEAAAANAVLPKDLVWFTPPGIPGLQGAWVLGAEQKPGAYLLRVKLAPGARIPPHTHPDERNTTVLSGTLHVGFGETF